MIDVKLASREYAFHHARAVIFASEPVSEVSTSYVSELLSKPPAEPRAEWLSLEDNWIRGVKVAKPGKFMLILSALEVERLADGRKFRVPLFAHGEFSLTESDLKKGAGEIDVNPGGIFKIVALDKQQRPIANKHVLFSAPAAMIFSAGATTDDKGEFIFLGNPTHYIFSLGTEGGEPYGLMILPL